MTDTTAIPQTTVAVGRPGFWERVLAFSVDLAVISLASNILQLFVNSGLVTLILALIYFVYLWSGPGGGRTWGMRVMGLRVVREDGSALDITRALIRFIGLLLSCLALFIGVIWVAFDAKKQGWHDKFAGSLVVADTPPAFPSHAVTLSIEPLTAPQRLWAFPVLGFMVKIIVLIPILIALVFVALAVVIAQLVLWIPVLLLGTYPAWGRQFITWYLRWSVQVNAFLYGLTDRYPAPSAAADHPVKLAIDVPASSFRLWAVPIVGIVLKFVILLPSYFLLSFVSQGTGLALLILWAPVLFTGVYPTWGYRFLVAALRWNVRVEAFLFGLTDSYPRSWNWEQ